jgi:transcription antitermination protein NusB
MLPKKKSREIAFQMLFAHDVGEGIGDDITALVMEQLKVTRKDVHAARDVVEMISSKMSHIDEIITKTSVDYDFERIQRAERNILRLAIYEILYDEDIPAKVALAEAIRLCRKFSTSESVSFVNAILDAVCRKHCPGDLDDK